MVCSLIILPNSLATASDLWSAQDGCWSQPSKPLPSARMNAHGHAHQLFSPFLTTCAREDVSIYARQVFLDIKARDMMKQKVTTPAAVDRMFRISTFSLSFPERTLIWMRSFVHSDLRSPPPTTRSRVCYTLEIISRRSLNEVVSQKIHSQQIVFLSHNSHHYGTDALSVSPAISSSSPNRGWQPYN